MNIKITKLFPLLLGPILFGLILFFADASLFPMPIWKVMALAFWMITWWVSEAVPLPVTALLPLILLPILEVFPISESTAPYASPIIFLFMGGFMIALALEKHKLHMRIALNLIRLTGTNANGIILGFMLATACLSMWISNTATTVMMLPIAMSVINVLEKNIKSDYPSHQYRTFAMTLLLSVAYAANVGGTATIIGTPPNVVLVGYARNLLDIDISFSSWLLIGIPISFIMLIITYLLLTRVLYPNKIGKVEGSDKIISDKLKELGPFTREERLVTILFALTAFCWIFKGLINNLLGQDVLNDTITAMSGGLAMFIVPVDTKNIQPLLVWEDTKRLPWGILLLFGGGMCVANAMEHTGIVEMVGEAVASYDNLSLWIIVALLAGIALFMTELMSNVALTTVFVPVIFGIAEGLQLSPLQLAIPATLATSFAFMLPVSTPPNAIVFSGGYIRIRDMMKAGALLNVVSIIMLMIFGITIVQWVYG